MIADEPPLTESQRADAYCAAAPEHLAFTHGFRVPAWTSSASRFLERPSFPRGLDSLKAIPPRDSPIAFRRRMIFVDAEPLHRPRKGSPRFGGEWTRDRSMAPLAKDDILRGLGKIDRKARDADVLIDLAI